MTVRNMCRRRYQPSRPLRNHLFRGSISNSTLSLRDRRHWPSLATTQHLLKGGSQLSYPDRTCTGWTAPASQLGGCSRNCKRRIRLPLPIRAGHWTVLVREGRQPRTSVQTASRAPRARRPAVVELDPTPGGMPRKGDDDGESGPPATSVDAVLLVCTRCNRTGADPSVARAERCRQRRPGHGCHHPSRSPVGSLLNVTTSAIASGVGGAECGHRN